jgi:hypothetical protein
VAPGAGDVVDKTPAHEWRVAPWRREPLKAVMAGGIILFAVVGSWWFSGQEYFFGILAFLILWGSIGPFFVSTRFIMDDAGVEIDSPFQKRRRSWKEIRSYYVDRYGATLSPFSGRSWLEAYRSIRILFGEHEAAIRKVLHEKLGEPAGTES